MLLMEKKVERAGEKGGKCWSRSRKELLLSVKWRGKEKMGVLP